MDKLLLTPEEAADALSIGRSKLYELLAQGLIGSIRVGACRRIPVAAIIEFVGRLQEASGVDGGQAGVRRWP
jgi:excisionase family DNA binding protein